MLQFFRNIFKSKIGIALTLAFLGLIALAFASSDVANTGMFGGVAGGEQVARVGDTQITTSDLASSASNAVTGLRQSNPTLTMQSFIAGGGLDDLLDQMITRTAIFQYGQRYGLRAGDRLVDSEIVNIPEFRGLDGKFNEASYRQALSQRGLSEAAVRDDFAKGLIAKQLMSVVNLSPRMPAKVATRYARLLQEAREGRIAAVISAPFAPEDDPDETTIEAYYQENRDRYIRPERRVIRYAAFDASRLTNVPEPTQAQIEERYKRDAAQYAALETRSLTQLVAPTQAAAQAIVDEVNGGKSLETAAQEKGLRTSPLTGLTREALASSASEEVSAAAFTAERGQLAALAQGSLGWYVLRVDAIEQRPARSLDEAREEIVSALNGEMRRQALNDAMVRIEDDFAEGRSLAEVADNLGLELETTPPVIATGEVYGSSEQVSPELARAIPTAFQMEEGEPQLAEVVNGTQFVIFDVTDVTASAIAPLSEIQPQVMAAWRHDQAMAAAGAASRRILDRMEQGSSIADAVAAEDVELPVPETVKLTRQDLASGGEVPRALALMFSMAQGTVKRLESPESQAWFIIALDSISAPELETDAPLARQAVVELSRTTGDEYGAQYVTAVKSAIEVSRNQTAIDAVIAQLTGNTN